MGLVKQCLYKTARRGNLIQKECEEIVLDLENTLNNRRLMYVEEYIQRPVLTPNTLLYGQPLLVPEEYLDEMFQKLRDDNGISTNAKMRHEQDGQRNILKP